MMTDQTDLTALSFGELRDLAKQKDINTFQMGRQDIIDALTGKKTGKKSWKPAVTPEVSLKEPGFRYRWCNDEPDNIERKKQEGWEVATPVNGDHALAVSENIGEGGTGDTVVRHRGRILMRMDEETAQARDAYYAEKTRQQTVTLKQQLESEAQQSAPGAKFHGAIVIQ